MSDKSLYIDTFMYTGIVNDIKSKAALCNLSGQPLVSVKAWDNTDIGVKMKEVLNSVYATEVLYKSQSSQSLPTALFKLRDSITSLDKTLSDSLKVDSDNNGE